MPPKEGRQIAEEIGQMYYETSAYSLYGVHEVFDNVIRAALIARRQHRFWQSNLKKVHKPIVQVSEELNLKSIHPLWMIKKKCSVGGVCF